MASSVDLLVLKACWWGSRLAGMLSLMCQKNLKVLHQDGNREKVWKIRNGYANRGLTTQLIINLQHIRWQNYNTHQQHAVLGTSAPTNELFCLCSDSFCLINDSRLPGWRDPLDLYLIDFLVCRCWQNLPKSKGCKTQTRRSCSWTNCISWLATVCLGCVSRTVNSLVRDKKSFNHNNGVYLTANWNYCKKIAKKT